MMGAEVGYADSVKTNKQSQDYHTPFQQWIG